jgi:hypothetical protein
MRVNDSVRPSGHNLTVITNLMRQELPGFFSLLTWELGLSDFARAIGAPLSASADTGPATAAAPLGLQLATLEVSRSAAPREGWVYPGIYLGFRKAFANTGMTIAKGLIIRLESDRLTARASDGTFHYRGEALLLRGQLFMTLEESTRLDEILTFVLNGVAAPMAQVLDGLMTGVALDRTSTPSSTTIAFQRIEDTSDAAASDEARWAELVVELGQLNAERDARARMPKEFAQVIDNLVGVPRAGGETDHVLRVP